jgi:hypothetical protein
MKDARSSKRPVTAANRCGQRGQLPFRWLLISIADLAFEERVDLPPVEHVFRRGEHEHGHRIADHIGRGRRNRQHAAMAIEMAIST